MMIYRLLIFTEVKTYAGRMWKRKGNVYGPTSLDVALATASGPSAYKLLRLRLNVGTDRRAVAKRFH